LRTQENSLAEPQSFETAAAARKSRVSRAAELLGASKEGVRLDPSAIAHCIDACLSCAQACTACADACLAEEDPSRLADCIRLNWVCAGACEALTRALSVRAGHTETLEALLSACRIACGACAEECERHAAHHEHCRICAEECRSCERACEELLAALASR
jgi:hypothetical protein